MKQLLYFLLLLSLSACREPFVPELDSPGTNYLVVEGVINSSGMTSVRLSRTGPLEDRDAVRPETGAVVRIEGEDNSSYLLRQVRDGAYISDDLTLSPAVRYRLYINTPTGEYVSDYAAVKRTPELAVEWVRDDRGVTLYANTSDPQKETRYYQWEYAETWEFWSNFSSNLKYQFSPNGQLIERVVYHDPVTLRSDESIFRCWQSEESSRIMIQSTTRQTEDVVHYPLQFIENHSWKLSKLYSMQVRQYALTREAFEYLERMKKNTEEMGSVFDPQPSQLVGNLRSLQHPDEPVIGYVPVAQVRVQRIFIEERELPGWNYNPGCAPEIEVGVAPDFLMAAFSSQMLPTYPAQVAPGGTIQTIWVADKRCVDCTLRGTNVKPDFWP